MNTIFNLDLNKKNHTTSFAYQIPSNTQEMYFRIIENDYVIDYSRLIKLVLKLESENGTVYVQDTSKLSTYKNETVVEYDVISALLRNTDVITVTPTVQLSNKTVILSPFKIYLYDTESNSCANTNMRNVLTSINYFNYMLSLYYDSIKRDQIGQPSGVVPLDSNGDIPLSYFPSSFTNHITDKLIDTATKKFYDDNGKEIGIHGLKLDDKWRLRYYDEEDQTFYVANSIHGGNLVNPQKPPEWNIFGGTIAIPAIDAMTFKDTLNDYMDGGKFADKNDDTVDANFIDAGNLKDDNSIFGGTIT